MAVAITATEQADYPPRVLVSVTGLTIGDTIELYRVVGGERTPVRAGTSASVPDTSFLRVDAELPFGVPVTYVAVVNGTDEYTTTATAHTLPGGKVAVSDAVNGNSAEAVILAWDEKAYDRQSSVFKVGGRNVVVSGDPGMFEGGIELFVETTSSRDNLMATLSDATEAVVQIRQPGGYDGVDSYLAVLTVAERRWSQDGSDQRRVISLRVAEVEGWAPTLEALGFTLQDIANIYDTPGPILNANPYFETDASNWTTIGGTAVRSTAQFHQGAASLLFTPDGVTGSVEARAENVPVSAGNTYRAQSWVRCAVSRNVAAAIIWRNASAGIISTTSVTFAVTANTWTQITVDGTAPVGAALAMRSVTMGSTPPASNTLYVDEATIREVGALQDLANDYATLLALAQGNFS